MTTKITWNGEPVDGEEAVKRLAEFIRKGKWLPFLDPLREQSTRPWDHNSIQIFRKEWDEPQTLSWRDIHPALNAEGLLWRPATS